VIFTRIVFTCEGKCVDHYKSMKEASDFMNQVPQVGKTSWISPWAILMGDVRLGEACSVWPGAVLRADENTIHIGDQTNVQDGAILHVSEGNPTFIGSRVTVAHGAVVHACRVGDGCLIGIRAVLLDGVVVGENCLIGAGSLLTPGTSVPSGSLVLGMPAKVVRPLNEEEYRLLRQSAESYVKLLKSLF
jgi:carbonic anhydrase/acetyltransferase-like protein (isoleucine patch superfamily)